MKKSNTLPIVFAVFAILSSIASVLVIKCNETKEPTTSTYDTKQIEYKEVKDSFRTEQSRLIQVNTKLEAENRKLKLDLKNAKAHENLVVKNNLETINKLRKLVPTQYLGLVDSIETLYKEIISSKDSSYMVAVNVINKLDSTLENSNTLIKSYQAENIVDSVQNVEANKEITSLREQVKTAKRNERIAYFVAALAVVINLIR